MISCLLGRDDVVKLLLKHGADTGLTDGDQLNSFHYSIWGMVREREREGRTTYMYSTVHIHIHMYIVHVVITLYISFG